MTVQLSDFADQFPGAEVVGTDLSPVQPDFVPPNCKFEIDDCNNEWTWDENSFDFVHIRYLFGAIKDWSALFRQAYRATKPGGWFESVEAEAIFQSDDGTVDGTYMDTLWNKLYREGGKKLNMSFTILSENKQRKAMEDAGFVDIQEKNFKVRPHPIFLGQKLTSL